jgi:hypothetical protein
MTARPETISHWFSLLVIAFYLLYRKQNPKWLLAWIPLQLLWTNMHEAYATGLILMFALLGSDWLIQYLRKELKFQRTPIIALLGSILAVAVNPRGFYMLLHPFEIFRQLSENKFTTELYSWDTPFYWSQWQSWAFVVVLGAVMSILLFSRGKNIKESLRSTMQLFSPGYWVILALFAYLSSSAFRNIPFFLLAASPVLMFYLAQKVTESRHQTLLKFSAMSLGVVAYVGIVSNLFYEFTGDRNRFGLEVDPGYNPIGLADAFEK